MNKDIRYFRSCYDHPAGYVGVAITEAIEKKGFIKKSKNGFDVTPKGWQFFNGLGIKEENLKSKSKRPMTRQCIDNTEKRPHLAGSLGAALLDVLFKKGWVERPNDSRAITVTPSGEKEFFNRLGAPLGEVVDSMDFY
ncbi:MAG: hypothetical protein J5I50_09355 [Chitinophagaceae bacterium]|nr:hypothetical protein [Chitinophagaceae bacterium]